MLQALTMVIDCLVEEAEVEFKHSLSAPKVVVSDSCSI